MYFKPRIFVSSTMGDKLELRKQIKNIFEKAGAEVALYEKDLTPSTMPNTYREDILQTDFVVFIIDERYGAKTNYGLSGTEEEFNIVINNHMPCHIYLKQIEKTDEAETFENLIKSKGISFFYYTNEKDLLKKLTSTCFTIARDICVSNLLQQKMEPNLINQLALQKDYKNAISYIKLFEKVFEIENNSNYNIQNSNLLISVFDVVCEFYLNNKNHFVDKKLEDYFASIFIAVKEINSFIATFSTPNSYGQNIQLFDGRLIFVSLNQFNIGVDFNLLNTKINNMRSLYNNLKTYIGTMKLEADLL